MRRIPAELSEMNDRLAVDTWNEDQLGGWDQGEQLRPLYDAARARLEALAEIRAVVAEIDERPTAIGERRLAEAARQIPAGYDYEWRERAERSTQRIEAIDPLLAALREGNSDLSIARAWQKVVSVNAREFVSPEYHARIDESVCRFPTLLELEDISLDLPPDELDRQLLAIWDEELFENSRDVDPWRDAYAAAVARKPLLEELERAMRLGSGREIERITAEPVLADYHYPRSWQEKFDAARQQLQTVEDLLQALADDDRSQFHEAFDQELLRAHADRLQVLHGAVDDWMNTEILPLEKLGLKVPEDSPGIRRESRKKYELRWEWPEQRFTHQCVIGICPEAIKPGTSPEHGKTRRIVTIPHEQWVAAEGKITLGAESDWSGAHIYVWAVFDLGFRLFYSEALSLGRLPKLWM